MWDTRVAVTTRHSHSNRDETWKFIKILDRTLQLVRSTIGFIFLSSIVVQWIFHVVLIVNWPFSTNFRKTRAPRHMWQRLTDFIRQFTHCKWECDEARWVFLHFCCVRWRAVNILYELNVDNCVTQLHFVQCLSKWIERERLVWDWSMSRHVEIGIIISRNAKTTYTRARGQWSDILK